MRETVERIAEDAQANALQLLQVRPVSRRESAARKQQAEPCSLSLLRPKHFMRRTASHVNIHPDKYKMGRSRGGPCCGPCGAR